MAAQLPKSVLSILTGEPWYLNGSCRDSFIRFNEDGTGLISSINEFVVCLWAEIDWKVDPQSLARPIYPPGTRGPHHIKDVEIEVTITKRPAKNPNIGYFRHENKFKESAFQPRTLTFRLEWGSFRSHFIFSYRMRFYPSLYPPVKDWEPDWDAWGEEAYPRNVFFSGEEGLAPEQGLVEKIWDSEKCNLM